jgi:cytochrome P450
MFAAPRKIILDSHFSADPYPVYKLLREAKPICPFPSARKLKEAWLLTRHEEIVQVLRDERFVRDIHKALSPEELETYLNKPQVNKQMVLSNHLLNRDKPEHEQVRPLLNRAFTSSAVQPLRPRLEKLAQDILHPHLARGEMDLISDFALPFTVAVIGEVLGIPKEIQISTRNLSDALSVDHFLAGLEAIVQQRLLEPQNDLTTQLVRLYQTEQITYEELIDNLFLIFVAGHETTMNMIANSVLLLLNHPPEWHRLCAQPEALAADMLDELLRYTGSVEKAWVRWATTDVQVGDVLIRRGDQVYLALASGNRDASVFENEDHFCPHRKDSKKHLAFGYGIHYCAGAALGRLELEVALRALLRHIPDLQLALPPEKLTWLRDEVMRGLQALPVRWQAKIF